MLLEIIFFYLKGEKLNFLGGVGGESERQWFYCFLGIFYFYFFVIGGIFIELLLFSFVVGGFIVIMMLFE